MARLKITWKRSAIGFPQDQRDTLRALGLKKLHASVTHEDVPSIRGMIRKVSHLVEVEEV